ncbi:MAG: autotransporter-associated beta strand repeat-containing protein [Terrimicrobiaceae bacterium]
MSNSQINKLSATSAVTDTISAPLLLNSSLVISDNAPAGLNISGGITANSAGTKTISNQGTGASAVQISGIIGGGSGKIAVTQNSTTSSLTLGGENTYTGHTLITAGTLTLGNNLALQDSVLDTSGAGTLAFSSGTNTPTFGGLTGSTSLTLASNVTALTLNTGIGVTTTYSGVLGSVTAGMALSKTGAGTQSLSGANTYTGGTTVSAGTLLVNNTTGSGTGSGSLAISSGAILGGTGTISGATTVSGSLSAGDGGNSIAKLVFGNSLNLTSSENITFSQSTGNLTAVPEPSTWALWTISLSTVIIFRRRRH